MEAQALKDFSDYKPNESGNAAVDGDIMARFSQLANKYEGKSGDEMMAAIIKEAEKGRKNGTLTDADIDSFAAAVSPLLGEKQRKMLGVIVERLKKN